MPDSVSYSKRNIIKRNDYFFVIIIDVFKVSNIHGKGIEIGGNLYIFDTKYLTRFIFLTGSFLKLVVAFFNYLLHQRLQFSHFLRMLKEQVGAFQCIFFQIV